MVVTLMTAGAVLSQAFLSSSSLAATGEPAVISISPDTGPVAGGTTVAITGSGFTNGTVYFGTFALSGVSPVSDTSFTVTSPSGADAGCTSYPCSVPVYVITPLATSPPGAEFTYDPVPTITSISPASGAGGGETSVNITGTGFLSPVTVSFGSTPATDVVVNSDTSISVTSPAGSGVVDVTVTTPGGTSAPSPGDEFTYGECPKVISVTPTQGPLGGGIAVTITGTGFTDVTGVEFGDTLVASFVVDSPTEITAFVPAAAQAGPVDVTVLAPGCESAIPVAPFTYVAPQPGVTGVTPNQGPAAGGTSVSITGTDLTGATAVNFGSNSVSCPSSSCTVNSDTSISATSPAATTLTADSTVDVTVTATDGTSTDNPPDDQFTYVAPPTVTLVTPNSGTILGGTGVGILGTNFTGATSVSFGSSSVSCPSSSCTVNSASSITATLPASSTVGPVDVAVTTPVGGTSVPSPPGDQFTYFLPVPVMAISPRSGPLAGGTAVTITGSGLTGTTAVHFGSNSVSCPSSSCTVNSDTSISAVSPAGLGTVDVTVTLPIGNSSPDPPADLFTYLPTPTVTAVSPNQGPLGGGTSVTITGTGFTDATNVSFGPLAASYVVNSDTSISAVTPDADSWCVLPAATSDSTAVPDPACTLDVTVTTPGGTSDTSTADQFNYFVAPYDLSLSPDHGSASGGTSVTITGLYVGNATAVDFGATPASFTVDNGVSVTAVAPPGSGIVDVTVTTVGGTSAASSDVSFTYEAASAGDPPPPPVVSGVSPSSGSTAGGNTVTITGSGFTGASGVTFGTTAALSFSVVSDTQITAVAPPEPAGQVDVTVNGLGGTSLLSSADHYVYVAPPPIPPNTPTLHGYWLVAGDGGVFTFGNAHFFGSTGSIKLQRPVVGMTPTDDDQGYWMVASDGGMFAFGDAKYFGSVPGLGLAPADSTAPKRLNAPIDAMVASPDGHGYLLVASDGGVFAFGDALFYGSCPGIGGCSGSVVAVVPDHGEHGYWIVTSTGHVYAFGNAASVATGEPGTPPAPITGATASSDGKGYLIVAANGDVYAYGDARSLGTAPGGISVPANEIVGIVASTSGSGYWLMGRTGAVYPYGDAQSFGSMAGRHLNAPIVTAAGF